jgi:RNA polymerase sigma factor (sigma-70 family)
MEEPSMRQSEGLPPNLDLGWDEIYRRLERNPDDWAAFTALERRVARWADRQLRSPAALRAQRDDVVADTCAAAVLGIARAYGAETFQGFVYGHYLNARRRALAEARQPVVPFGDLDSPGSIDSGPSTDELALLQRCLAELPQRERRAIELRYFANASSQEIATVLSVTEVNARRIVFNGLDRLRRSASRAWPLGRG